jgi:methylmalonyl-CoA mutase cobalamin-binding subunit
LVDIKHKLIQLKEFIVLQDFEKDKKLIKAFILRKGKHPKIMIAKLRQGGYEHCKKILAIAYIDKRYNFEIGSSFQSAKAKVKKAIEKNV